MAQSAAMAVLSPIPKRLLFARIGWMTYYAGPQTGDERPKGGGGYNKKHLGHEVFNFAQFHGHLYGTARAKSGHIDLTRIDPSARGVKKLEDVLIIFVARQRVVGWYQHASVHADTAQLPTSVTMEMRRRLKKTKVKNFEVGGYRFEANSEDATLLPTHERGLKIPGTVKGGFGQSNIRYSFRTDGKSEKSTWMQKAIRYVLNYDKANLLNSPVAEVSTEEAATVAQEKAAGFQSDRQIRRLIEEYAMKEAEKALKERGFREFENTSATKPYDLTCVRNGQEFFVEVKGTQTAGRSVILTKNEVEHVKAKVNRCILVVVHSVIVTGKKAVNGGTHEVTENWDLTEGELTETQYIWKR